MRLVVHKKTNKKVTSRIKKKVKIRKKIFGTPERPRLCVFKSNKYIYAQLVNDETGSTLVEFNSINLTIEGDGKAEAKAVGAEIAKKAQKLNVKNVVFDRNGFQYHGRIKSLADGAREAGLVF